MIGIDGSEEATHALEWAIGLAQGLDSEVVAVFAIGRTIYAAEFTGYAPTSIPPELDEQWRSEIKDDFESRWVEPLKKSGVRYRTVIEDGRPASVIAAVADRENADLIVVGRRGLGGVAEFLLGSVSHELTHHAKRPVLLISRPG